LLKKSNPITHCFKGADGINKHGHSVRHGSDFYVFSIVKYTVVAATALLCVIPFWLLIMGSFTSESSIFRDGFRLIPKEFSIEAYKVIFSTPARIINAYAVSIIVTFSGTFLSLLISSMTAYVLYRKDVKYRNVMAFFLFFTTLFNGGMMSYYVVVTRYLQLRDSIFILILSPMINVFYILILRNFFKTTIPDSLIEAAQVDGGGDLWVYLHIILPLSKAILAAVGFLLLLNYWNDWWTPMLFVSDANLHPLQYVLYQIISKANFAQSLVSIVPQRESPAESLKLAMVVISVGPVMFFYPFVQRFFVSGITIGAVKG